MTAYSGYTHPGEPPYSRMPRGERLAEAISAGFVCAGQDGRTLTGRLHECAVAAERRGNAIPDAAEELVRQIAALVEALENEVGA